MYSEAQGTLLVEQMWCLLYVEKECVSAVPTDVSCSMQKSASFGEFDGTSGGMSDGKEKDSHARKRKV